MNSPDSPIPLEHSRSEEHRSELSPLRLSIHDSIHLVRREDWCAVTSDEVSYLHYDHLCTLEDAMDGSMEFRYVVFHCQAYKPIGIAYFQVLDVEDNGSEYGPGVRRLGKAIGSRIVQELKVRSLVCGNAFHSGAHGIHFIQAVPFDQQLLAVETAMHELRSDERLAIPPAVLIFKEYRNENGGGAILETKNYHPLAMDVNMVMALPDEWKSLDDHFKSLTSKARTRSNTIMGRSQELVIKDLSAAEITAHLPKMQQLFDQVLERSPFIFGRLNVAVYPKWKAQWGEAMLFHGFFLNGELVGFNSAFVLGDTLDAHFVGIDYALNKEHMIYQRMLFDLLDHAFAKELRTINFGRAAEQAKSSIGAKPVDMLWYVKHRNALANTIVGPFLRRVKPGDFELRSPFKKASA